MTKVKTEKIKHSGILKTIAGLFTLGKNDYADVTPFHDDAYWFFTKICTKRLKPTAFLSISDSA